MRTLRWGTLAICLLPVLLFALSVARRLRFPYEYDWIEDGVLFCVRHLAAGHPLYTAPSVFFTPFLYTPVYFWLAAALSHVTGLNYVTLRLISVASTFGCLGVIFALVWRESRQGIAACAALATFASLYQVVSENFDIGRVDMLYLFWVLCALYATRRSRPILAAILWVTAFQTKQGVLPIALLALASLWPDRRKLITGVLTFVLLLCGSILWLSHLSGGWYRYYAFGLVSGFGLDRHMVSHTLSQDLLSVCGAALVAIAGACLWSPLPAARTVRFYVLTSMGMIVFTFYVRVHRGANVNSLLPLYAWVAVLFGCAVGRLLNKAKTLEVRSRRGLEALLLFTVILQVAMHLYSPWELPPSQENLLQRDAFEQQLRLIPGDVLVIGHPEDGLQGGKSMFASSEAVGAVIDSKNQAMGDRLQNEYEHLLRSGALQAVVLDKSADEVLSEPRVWLPRDFLRLYPLRVAAIGSQMPQLFSEPEWIYLPCSQAAVALRLDLHTDTAPCDAMMGTTASR